MNEFAIDTDACRGRQRRLIEQLKSLDAEWAMVTQPEMIQWLTGARFGPMFQSAAALSVEGELTLVAPGGNVPEGTAADEVLPFEAQWHSTLRNDQREACSAVLLDWLNGKPQPRRVGAEFSSFPPHLAGPLGSEIVDIEPTLYYLRRRKDPDELRMLRRAIDATRAMYAHAREVIKPGINELDLYCQLHSVGVEELGEPLTYFGQDFQCNSQGGPPRDREAQAGELYILDLGAGFRGYFSDNARTISVDGRPTAAQQKAWQTIVNVLALVDSTVKPGVSAQQFFHTADERLKACLPWKFKHHLGHGVGLFPHEAPHLNPRWDDTFEAGDVFTVEPGLYHEELRHGIRLEHNYRVTETGVELLTDFTLDL